MTTLVADNLKQLIRFEKKLYLADQATEGGSAAGFRKRIIEKYGDEPDKYIEALAEAADRGWRQPPRKAGPGLFSIDSDAVPEYLTRPNRRYFSGDDLEADDEEAFEQVDHLSATVNDQIDDAQIKLRQAARGSATAEGRAKQADEARRRAKGDVSKFLKDLADD
jgi:hypothetical protein